MIMGGVQVGRGEGGREKSGGECSINGGDRERLLSKLPPAVSKKH